MSFAHPKVHHTMQSQEQLPSCRSMSMLQEIDIIRMTQHGRKFDSLSRWWPPPDAL